MWENILILRDLLASITFLLLFCYFLRIIRFAFHLLLFSKITGIFWKFLSDIFKRIPNFLRLLLKCELVIFLFLHHHQILNVVVPFSLSFAPITDIPEWIIPIITHNTDSVSSSNLILLFLGFLLGKICGKLLWIILSIG